MSTQPETPQPEAIPPEADKLVRTSWFRRFKPWQFSLRTLLVLMAVASGVCWYYLLPKRHEEKLAGGYLLLNREYRGVGKTLEPMRGPGSQMNEVFRGENDGYWRLSDFQGRLLVDGNYRKGKESGWWTTYHPNGRKAVQGKMNAGERTGVWRTWSTSGQMLSEVNYQQNGAQPGEEQLLQRSTTSHLHGPAQYWHENGKLASKGAYARSERTGNWSEWNEQEQLIASGSYIQGKKHGPWKEATGGDPQRMVAVEYVHGLKKELLDAHLKALAERLETGDVSERLTLISVAAEFGEPALKLFDKLAADNGNRHVQLAAIAAIGRCGGEMAELRASLQSIVEGSDPRLAMDARRELYRYLPKQRRELLPELLKDAEQRAEIQWLDGLQALRELFALEPALRPEIFPVVLQITAKHVPGGQPDVLAVSPSSVNDSTDGPAIVAQWHANIAPYLKEGLESQDKQIRLAVVCLIRHLLIERNEMPSASTSTTERWEIPATLQPLVTRARQDSDPEVKEAADDVNNANLSDSGGMGGGGLF